MTFDLTSIEYPAFVVVYGSSKHHISTYNRSEYEEHFACDVCRSPDDAKRLLDGYPGHDSDLKIYAVPHPTTVHQLLNSGQSMLEYDTKWFED